MSDYTSLSFDANKGREQLWEYWREQLSGELPVLDLLTDRPRLAVQSYNAVSVTFTLPATLVRQVSQLSQASDTTSFMIFLAAFQVLLHRYTGQNDILARLCLGPTRHD
uniref:Condensation domain-containing protein n=1 Tax=Candidatus Kentrum sp. FW TaxID=2126338 RepID=A0A450U467_9GAMM|nr:MAG: Condensation domain-containing protein [Candidatus Kentron sp. FW]